MRNLLVEKLFLGTATEAEIAELLRLVRENPSSLDEEVATKLWEICDHAPALESDVFARILDRSMKKIQGKENQSFEKVKTFTSANQVQRFKLKRLGIAASVLIALAFFGWLINAQPSDAIVRTDYGEQQSLLLSDGSKVKLNANTRMVYEKDWSEKNTREVWLEGEAFFEVTKKPEKGQDFKVNTDAVTITVLGTSFNVNNHGNQTSVYLEEGEIKLHLIKLDSIILMKPGDLIVYRESDGQIINEHKVKTEYHTSWKNGVLIFRSSQLSEVLQKIEETYGVHFEGKENLDYSREINFPLPIDRLETAISILNKTIVDLEIRKVGDKYFIERI